MRSHALATPFALALCLAVTGCRSAPPVLSDAPPAAHPDVAGFGWIAGRWESPEKAQELWVPMGDTLLGLSCSERPAKVAGWEVLMLRRDKAGLVFAAMPNGAAETAFTVEEQGERSASFKNPQHDFPQVVRYARGAGDKASELSARIEGDGRGIDFSYALRPPAPAPELVARDEAFARDSALRGAEAWHDAFDDDGALGRGKDRIAGKAAIRDAMKEIIPPGTHLEWRAAASLLCAAGDLGFTAGPWRFTVDGEKGPTEAARGAYATVWRKDESGSWRALYDVGDPIGVTR